MVPVKFRRIAPVSVLLAVGMACGSQPIPRIAVEGTTITLAIPREFAVGFGRIRSAELIFGFPIDLGVAPQMEDLQRGELVFSLVEPGVGTEVPELFIRHISKVGASPLSPAALNDSPDYLHGQVLAFVDIPKDVLPSGVSSKDYLIQITRKRRTTNGAWEDVASPTLGGQPWLGWASTDSVPPSVAGSPNGIAIRIVEGDGADHFTDYVGWGSVTGSLASTSIDEELNDLVPYPNFAFMVPPPGQGTPPAAWEAEFSYPAGKVTIRGVSARTGDPSAAIVSWQADEPPSGSCSTQDGSLRIQVVDPKRVAEGVWVAYSLDNFVDCGRIQSSDFTVVSGSLQAYDVNGSPIAFTYEKNFSGFF